MTDHLTCLDEIKRIASSLGDLPIALENLFRLQAQTEHGESFDDALISSAKDLEEAFKAIGPLIACKNSLQRDLLRVSEERIKNIHAERRWVSYWLNHIIGGVLSPTD
jgi:hypothetical protein